MQYIVASNVASAELRSEASSLCDDDDETLTDEQQEPIQVVKGAKESESESEPKQAKEPKQKAIYSDSYHSALVHLYNVYCNQVMDSASASDADDEPGPPPKGHPCCRFFTTKPGRDISIATYIERFVKFTCASRESYVIGLIYIDRLVMSSPDKLFRLNKCTFHRLFLVALLLASKYNDDFYDSNRLFSRVGGITLKELNVLEECMIGLLDYDCFVHRRQYKHYLGALEQIISDAE